MSTHLPRLARASLLSGLMMLALAASASSANAKANRTAVDLRVVTDDGKTLIDKRQLTGATKVKTSKKAKCLGTGGGSGKNALIPEPAALGLVADAARNHKALRPLSIADGSDFGLGVCGLGGYEAPKTGFWYLKHNHEASMASGDQTIVKSRDEVLWFLIADWNQPTPVELELKVPATRKAGKAFTARVFEYADNGSRSPAAGVSVGGETTDADGNATIAAPTGKKAVKLQATRAGAIPSRQVKVCLSAKGVECPTGHLVDIGGTQKADRIKSGRHPVKIRSYAGNDKVDVSKAKKASPVKVDCGKGKKDVLIVARGQKVDQRGCEKVKRKR
jgi:hypothetical protein